VSAHGERALLERGLFEPDLPERVEPTTHARLAWLERVDPTEEYPAGAIRDAWNRAEFCPEHPGARRGNGLYLVYDLRGDVVVILTVYPVERGCSA
jgi:hypothetical protein